MEQKVAEARTAAAESTSIVSKMAQVVPLPTPSPPADKPSTAALYFLDDFNGKTLEELGDKWEIIRPDADSYALEKDGLLIINSKAGSLADDNIPNLFRLKTAMPEGNWTATVKFSSEFPAANEMFYLALLQDKENWTAATLVADFHCCPNSSLWIYLSWKSPAKVVSWPGQLTAVNNLVDRNKFLSDNKLRSQRIYLRLQRAGHDFIASSRLESSGPDG